ncbi:MAG: ATP-binding cassette domain-containing protein [Pseudomonadota bacterium]
MTMPDRPLAGLASRALGMGRGILWLAFFLSFVVNVLRLAGPMFMILIYDRVLPARSQETLVALFFMLAVFLLAQGVIDYARRRILARFGAQFQERLETGLFDAARQAELFEPGRSKPLAGLEEVDALRRFFHSASLIAIFDFFWTPMFLAVVFVLDPLLGWVCLGGMAVILLLMLIRMALIGTREADTAAASRSITDLKTTLAVSRATLRHQDMARGFRQRWLAARRLSRDRAIALKDWTAWFDGACDIAVQLARYGVLAVGAWLTLDGMLTIGAMVAATFLVTRVLVPVEKFLTELPEIAEAQRNWALLRRILLAKATDPATPHAEEGGNPRARLSLVNVSVRSPLTGESLLRGVTLDLAPGQMAQVCGTTGAGKTVLAETIIGAWRRSSGSLLVNGQNLAHLTDAETEALFGYVPETPLFVAGTLAENIARLDPDADPARVAAAARKACLHALISALPDGYHTVIDAQGSGLSRGQRHQLALARAVYRNPAILVVDDPDPMLLDLIPRTMEKTFQQVMDRGGAVLLLARKPLALAQISAVWTLEDGRLKPRKRSATPANPLPASPLPANPRIAVVADGQSPPPKPPEPKLPEIVSPKLIRN